MSLPSSCPLSTCLTSFRCFRFFRTISLCFFYQHEFLLSTLQTFLSPLPLLIPYVFRIFFWPVSRNSLINYIETRARKRSTFIAFFAQISVIQSLFLLRSPTYKFGWKNISSLSTNLTVIRSRYGYPVVIQSLGKVASKWNRADFQDGRPVNLCVSPTSQSRSSIFAYYYRIFHKLTESA